MSEKKMVAYCSSPTCDPKQKTSKGVIKESARDGQKICECGWALFWFPAHLTYGTGRLWKNHGKRKEELEFKTKF